MSACVVVADDNPDLLEVHCEIIAELGCECIPVGDGEAALEQARARRPDVIVTDHAMPGRSGIEIACALRDDPELRGVRVILVSGSDLGPEEERAVWRVLRKPVDRQRLLRAIREAIASRR